jgi:osmotically-inducible protein OsmY
MNAKLQEAVESALRTDGRVTSKHIHVLAGDDSVTLEGTVDSLDEFGIVQEIVESVQGVSSVENGLQIESEVDTGPCCRQM